MWYIAHARKLHDSGVSLFTGLDYYYTGVDYWTGLKFTYKISFPAQLRQSSSKAVPILILCTVQPVYSGHPSAPNQLHGVH